MSELQSPLQQAIAKASKTIPARKPSQRGQRKQIVAYLREKPFLFVTGAQLAPKLNLSTAQCNNALGSAFKVGLVTRRPTWASGRGVALYEYAITPALAVANLQEKEKHSPPTTGVSIHVEPRFTLSIHGCSATFTLYELQLLAGQIQTFINAAIKEKA